MKDTNFSEHLFWDVETASLDFDKNDVFIIGRVLQYGYYKDWIKLMTLYGRERIKKKIIQIRHLDDISLHFASNYFKIPLERFRCYTLKQLNKNYWNY
jgi:hypothetical protein